MKDAKDLIPWKTTDISIRPYEGFWSMNPSIHFDGSLWRCVLRCCDYGLPDGVMVRSKNARVAGQQTKNAMVIFDPASWQLVKIFKMREKDDLPRQACPHVGYEDMRLFRTDKGGLQGIAAALHLRRDREPRATDVRPQHQPPEQVLLSFDEDYDIVDAHPIRGDGFSGIPQKNWVPFDDCVEPRFMYSLDKGRMFGEGGPLSGDEAVAIPAFSARPAGQVTTFLPPVPSPSAKSTLPPPLDDVADEQGSDRTSRKPKRTRVRGGDVRIVRGGRIKIDTVASRPSTRPRPSVRLSARSTEPSPRSRGSARAATVRGPDDSARVMGTGRMLLPRYEGLRGGTQLVRVADDAWLGVGHEMKFVNGRKFYWHIWYLVDSRGQMTAASEPMKLASAGIEFAAGMAVDGDRVVVSYGVDDMESWLGETSLSAVMDALVSVGPR